MPPMRPPWRGPSGWADSAGAMASAPTRAAAESPVAIRPRIPAFPVMFFPPRPGGPPGANDQTSGGRERLTAPEHGRAENGRSALTTRAGRRLGPYGLVGAIGAG